MPHPGQRDHPEDRWSNGSAPSGGDVPRADLPRPRRRALRLAGAIGIIVGGLCVVLGTLALVVELGPRHPGKQHLAAHKADGNYQGSGSGHPETVQIPGPGPYRIAWSFSCPPGRSGTFRIAENQAATWGKVDVKKSGPSGNGALLDTRSGKQRSLFIISDCGWHARVFKPVSTATPSPRPVHPHNKLHGHKAHPHKKRGDRPNPKHLQWRHSGTTEAEPSAATDAKAQDRPHSGQPLPGHRFRPHRAR